MSIQELKKNQNGIALMVVLWVLVLLSALATEFAYSMRTEVNATRNYKEDVESYYIAKAGIQLAMAELLKEARFHSIHPEYGFVSGIPKESEIKASEESAGEFEIINRTNIELGRGTVTYQITDENGKTNVNRASREVLIKVLDASGMEIGEEQDIIADSILDWIDRDDEHRLNGAESDFYLMKDEPYNAKNGSFDSLDELLKVRGITREVLYGSESAGYSRERPFLGLVNFLTIQDIRIFNPNTASLGSLSVYFSEDKIAAIVKSIEEKGFYDETVSSHFRIEATGRLYNSGTKHTIVAIAQKFGIDDEATLLIRYWKDNALKL